MTKNNNQFKQKVLTEQDMKIIQSDPTGLADYVVHTKVKEAKKTAFIFILIFTIVAFVAGLVTGMNLAKSSIPNNVVTVQVSGDAAKTTAGVQTPEGK